MTVGLGIIGCGIAARERHWPALRTMPERFKVVMVCNNTVEKAQEFAQMTGASYVTDYRELLRHPEVEAVDVVLPFTMNFEVASAALECGKHVIVEKPLAANLSDARQMVELEKGGRVTMVAENFLYHPLYQRLKKILTAEQIGKPYGVFWDFFRVIDAHNRYLQTSWRLEGDFPGGFVLDGGVHNVAALRFLFGDFVAGNSWTQSVKPDIGSMDGFSLQFAMENGVKGVLNIFLSAIGYAHNRIVILGEEGAIRVENNREITIHNEEELLLCETIDDDVSYRNEFIDFHRGITEGKAVLSTFKNAYRDLEVLLQAFESAHSLRKI